MTEASFVTEQVLETWDAVRRELVKLSQWGLVFRGQQQASWPLAPTLERCESVARREDEQRVFNYFRRRASPLLPAGVDPSSAPTVGWLSLLQHYGGPTRLLDFTHSPYVGAFFALEAPNLDGSAHAIWAAHPQRLQQWAATVISAEWAGGLTVESATTLVESRQETLMAAVLQGGGRSFNAVVPLEPDNFDLRQSSQQCLFLCAGTITRPFMEVMSGLPPDDWPIAIPRLVKLVVPDSVRDEALDDLARMNVTPASLFPGLEGLGRSARLLITRTELDRKAIINALEGLPASFGPDPFSKAAPPMRNEDFE